jgi:hypothetical protein
MTVMYLFETEQELLTECVIFFQMFHTKLRQPEKISTSRITLFVLGTATSVPKCSVILPD